MRIRTLTAMYLLVSAFAIPASAGAYTDYSTVNSLTGDSAESSQPTSDPISVNAIVPPVSEANSSGSPSVGSDYASLNAIAGPPADTPAFVSGSPGSGEGFDWPSALVGAGAAIALAALGTAAMLTARRRTAISPSASAS